MTDTAATIRSLLGADPTPEQQDAADALLAALAPPMEEPAWPAWVMAKCPSDYGVVGDQVKVHARRIGNGDPAGWGCDEICTYMSFGELRDARPLTPDEYREHGLHMPAEPITDELVKRCAEAADWLWSDLVRAVLRAAGHPEVQA